MLDREPGAPEYFLDLNIRSQLAFVWRRSWKSQDEASLAITGHPAEEQEPRQMATQPGGNLVGGNPDPGSNRAARVDALRLANQLASAGNRNAAALALLVAASVDEPGSIEKEEARSWWKREAEPDARDLIDAEVEE